MKPKNIDTDLAQSKKALLRAGQRARELAISTGTPLVTWRDGQVRKEMVTERKRSPDSGKPRG